MTVNFPQFPPPVASRVTAAKPTRISDWTPSLDRGPYRMAFKRVFDVLVVIAFAPLVVPLVALLALIVAREGGSPFYSQARIGKDRRAFRMWKLRSMVTDADDRMEECLAANPDARDEWNKTQKLKNDPRITGFGRFLRKSSLDELPQLWNVLLGDMSLVGPRPMMLSQETLYPCNAYYSLRPGITGYWQTSGRNDTSFAARAMFDRAYERDLSFRTDIIVLARTASTVLRGTGY